MTKTPYLPFYYTWADILAGLTNEEFGSLIRKVTACCRGESDLPALEPHLEVACKFMVGTIERSDHKAASFEKTLKTKSGAKKASHTTHDTKSEEKAKYTSTKSDIHKACEEACPTEGSFTPPALDEVKALFKERGYTSNPEEFYNFYESKGWLVGQSPMRSWEASCANWEIKTVRERATAKKPSGGQTESSPQQKPRYGNFDPHEAFQRAVERTYREALMPDDDED